ncbi:MAG: protein BatD [Phycisphaerae bacterium]|nr:protein BatD [Phycisphaerae bacterium]
MRRIRYSFAVLALIAALVPGASGQVRISAQVDTNGDIYVGDNFRFHVVITGSDKPGQVDLEPLRRYNPQSIGNSRETSSVNFNTPTTRMIMSYSLRASEIGQIRLPSLTVVIDGKTYRTNPVNVNVVKPGTTDRLDIEMALSEQRCFAGQPVLLTVKFYYSADIRNSQFNVPALRSDAFYFESPDVGNQQAEEYDLGTGATVLVSKSNEIHNGRQSILITLRKILIPKTAGRIEIEPAVVSTDVAVGRVQSRSLFGSQVRYQRFMVESEPLELTVLPLPEESKPAQFYGLVGRYTIEASATPTQVSVGDPITLTIRIGGGTYLKPVRWPALEQVPDLAANFKIPSQKASPAIAGGVKVFTQTIRANNDNVTEIPSVPLAYFDAEKGKYATVQSEPIKLDVAPTKILTNADLEGADFAPVNREVEAIKKGLSANYENLDVLKDMSFSPLAALANPVYAAIWALPLLTFISSVVAKLLTSTSPEKVAIRRRRQACGRAIAQLKKMASADSDRRGELLVSIMKQYIGDRFDKTAGSLTPDDCYDAITAATADEQNAGKYRETIADFEAGRYASMEVNVTAERIREIVQLVRAVEKNCGK